MARTLLSEAEQLAAQSVGNSIYYGCSAGCAHVPRSPTNRQESDDSRSQGGRRGGDSIIDVIYIIVSTDTLATHAQVRDRYPGECLSMVLV